MYEKLPVVLDLEEAMKPGAPILHDDLRTKDKKNPNVSGSTNVAARYELSRGDLEGLCRSRCHRRACLQDQHGAPGLYRAARLRGAALAPMVRC